MAPKPRSRPSKKTISKVKKVMAKKTKQKAKSNLDTKFVQCTTNLVVSAAQGVTVFNYLYAPIPMIYNNPNSIGFNQQFNFYAQQYERVRINKMTIEYIPKANVLDLATAQNDALFTLTGDGLIHTCIDRNSAAPSNISMIQKYPSYKAYSVLKKFKRHYKVLWPKGVWLDAKKPLSDQQSIIDQIGGNGTVTMYAENLLEDVSELFNEPIANLKVTWDCVFEAFSPPTLKFDIDASGNKTILLTAQESVVSVPISKITALNGTIQDYITQPNDDTQYPIDNTFKPI